MSTANKDKKLNDSRWWEFYFVRYFVGTVVGGAILLYLNASETSSLHNLIIPGVSDVSKLDAQRLSLLTALGLAYCYIASAPVLVLHATRGVFLAKDTTTYQWFFFGSLALVGAAAVGFYAFQSAPDTKFIMSVVLLAIVLCLQLVPLGFSIHKEGERAHAYYANLTKARSRDTEEARQYMESYKHLREHGNAFFILLFELALGTILATFSKPNIALIALLLWIMPAALVWVIGTVLEYRFTNEPPKL
jgi:small-conductance mechanosensitive channel